MQTFYRILALSTMISVAIAPLSSEGLIGTAVLVEGTAASAGLPGFGSNRIPALFGRYRAASGEFVSAWATPEPLVFDESAWVSESVQGQAVRGSVTEERQQVWCLTKSMSLREGALPYARTTFLVQAASSVPSDDCRRFLIAFAARSEFFFESANRVSDLSFPAVLDVSSGLVNPPKK